MGMIQLRKERKVNWEVRNSRWKHEKNKKKALPGSFQAAMILSGITEVIIVYVAVDVFGDCDSLGRVCDSPLPPALDFQQHANGFVFFFPAISIKALLN